MPSMSGPHHRCSWLSSSRGLLRLDLDDWWLIGLTRDQQGSRHPRLLCRQRGDPAADNVRSSRGLPHDGTGVIDVQRGEPDVPPLGDRAQPPRFATGILPNTSPIQVANCRPVLKVRAAPSDAPSAVVVTGPAPGSSASGAEQNGFRILRQYLNSTNKQPASLYLLLNGVQALAVSILQRQRLVNAATSNFQAESKLIHVSLF